MPRLRFLPTSAPPRSPLAAIVEQTLTIGALFTLVAIMAPFVLIAIAFCIPALNAWNSLWDAIEEVKRDAR